MLSFLALFAGSTKSGSIHKHSTPQQSEVGRYQEPVPQVFSQHGHLLQISLEHLQHAGGQDFRNRQDTCTFQGSSKENEEQ